MPSRNFSRQDGNVPEVERLLSAGLVVGFPAQYGSPKQPKLPKAIMDSDESHLLQTLDTIDLKVCDLMYYSLS